ncbi:MAG: SRPBCC domain-containing protein [Planctomycetaceae bacterium]
MTSCEPTNTPSTREIVVERWIDAPRATVFAAWTDPKHLAAWWGPEGYASDVIQMDVRPGGVFQLNMRGPDGATYACQGVYSEVIDRQRLVITGPADCGHACGAGLPPRATVTVTFAERDGGTLLTIHTKFASEQDCAAAANAGFEPGWVSTLERLANQLAVREHQP